MVSSFLVILLLVGIPIIMVDYVSNDGKNRQKRKEK